MPWRCSASVRVLWCTRGPCMPPVLFMSSLDIGLSSCKLQCYVAALMVVGRLCRSLNSYRLQN